VCTKQLSDLQALSSEDLIDLLTLKDNHSGLTNGFYEASMVYARGRGLQPGRKQNALQTIWRRAFIYDDWRGMRATANLTDDEVNERLRETALFTFIYSLKQRPDSADLWLRPTDTLTVPSLDHIAARYPQCSRAELEDLASDLLTERQMLQDLLDPEGDVGLEDYYAAIIAQLSDVVVNAMDE